MQQSGGEAIGEIDRASCQRCGEMIAREAQVCRFCGDKQPFASEAQVHARRERAMGRVGLAVFIVLGILFLFGLLGALMPQKSREQQIMDGCRSQFADEGEERVNQCAIDITMKELDAQERKKMKRAEP